MSSLFAQFATDKKAELEGIDVAFGTINDDGSAVTFRIARMGTANRRYKQMLERETKPYAHQIRNETLPPEVDEEISLKLFCNAVLLGWENMIAPEVFGTIDRVEYTPEFGMKLLKALPELYAALREQAAKSSNFRAAEVETDTKN